MASNGQPPCYILVSHPTAPAAGSSATVSSFSHPAIEYNYADDSPMMLLPRHPDEQVLILDYDPADPINPGVKSISSSLAVTGVKVADAPGAGEAQENDKMYIIETTQAAAGDDRVNLETSHSDFSNVHALLAQYKQRNAVLRRALEYGKTQISKEAPNGVSSPQSITGPVQPQ